MKFQSLPEKATHKEFVSVRQEGARSVQRRVVFYNLDVILSVGYRVKSQRGVQFRIWATQRLREILALASDYVPTQPEMQVFF